MLDEEAAPPGPLEAADPPLLPPGEDDAPPVPPPLEEAAPPLPELLVPPIAPALPVSLLEELEEPGAAGALLEEDEEPPGTTIVSFSFVVEDEDDPLGLALPPGTTVVVSLRSQAERARAPIRTNKYPLRFMSTRLSFRFIAKCNTGLSKRHAGAGQVLVSRTRS